MARFLLPLVVLISFGTVGCGEHQPSIAEPTIPMEELDRPIAPETAPANREVIGSWLDEGRFFGGRIKIFLLDGKLYFQQKFRVGMSFETELVETESPLGRRFDSVEESTTGDHWVIDARGDLEMRDNDGLIRTAKRIE